MTGVEKVIGIEKPNNVLLRWCVKNKLSELFIIIMSYFSLTSIHRSWHWWWASFYNDLYCIPTPPTPRSTSTLFCSSEYCHIFVQFLLYMYIYSRYVLKMKSTLFLSLPLFLCGGYHYHSPLLWVFAGPCNKQENVSHQNSAPCLSLWLCLRTPHSFNYNSDPGGTANFSWQCFALILAQNCTVVISEGNCRIATLMFHIQERKIRTFFHRRLVTKQSWKWRWGDHDRGATGDTLVRVCACLPMGKTQAVWLMHSRLGLTFPPWKAFSLNLTQYTCTCAHMQAHMQMAYFENSKCLLGWKVWLIPQPPLSSPHPL